MFGLATKKDLKKIKLEIGYRRSGFSDELVRDTDTIHRRVEKLAKNPNSPHHIVIKIPKHIPELCTQYTYPLDQSLTLQEFATMLCDHLKLQYTPESCTPPKLIRQRKVKK